MNDNPDENQAPAEVLGAAVAPRGAGSITVAGLIVMYASVASFGGVGFLLYRAREHPPVPASASAPLQAPVSALSQYGPELLLCAIGVFTGLLSVKLLRAGGLSPSDPLPVVNPVEWKILSNAITTNQDDPVGQYIRLSSLTGATGLFTKLGLSGLPLATIGLTLFFAVASIFVPGGKFYELTQLTLGAFVGSFVQKQVGALRDAAANSPPAGSASSGTTDGSGSSAKTSAPASAEVERPRQQETA